MFGGVTIWPGFLVTQGLDCARRRRGLLVWISFQRRRAQLLGLIVLLNALSGFDFEGPASPNGSRLIDRVGNILVISFVDFLLCVTSSSPKR